MPTLLSTTQTLKMLGISSFTTLWKLGKEGHIRPVKLGRGNKYKLEDIENFLKNPPLKPSYMTSQEIKAKLA